MRNDSEAVIARARSVRGDLVAAFKRVCGMPDYPGYLRHMAEQHPDTEILSERMFFEEHIKARYGGGATRCC